MDGDWWVWCRSVIKEAAPSLKSSVAYSYLDDRRDDSILPTNGSLFSVNDLPIYMHVRDEEHT